MLILKNSFLNIWPLFTLLVLPIWVFFALSSYPLPNIQYVAMALIFIKQFFIFNENEFRKNKRNKYAKILEEKNKKTASSKTIEAYISKVILSKQIAAAVNIFILFIITMYFNRF